MIKFVIELISVRLVFFVVWLSA